MKTILAATVALGLLASTAAAAGHPEKQWDKVRVSGDALNSTVLIESQHALAINATSPFELHTPNR